MGTIFTVEETAIFGGHRIDYCTHHHNPTVSSSPLARRYLMDFSGQKIMSAGAGAIVVGVVLIGVGFLAEYFETII